MRNWRAEVTVAPSDHVSIVAAADDRAEWESLGELIDRSDRYGYGDAVQLVQASVKVLAERYDLESSFAVSYRTSIPRQVGLGGSSALVIAAQQALARFCDIDVPTEIRASLALVAEADELGVASGLQDRVAQVYGGVVAMDFSPDKVRWIQGLSYGRYEPLPAENLPPLFVAYVDDEASPSGSVHRGLRARWERGDREVHDAMQRLAALAVEAHAAVRWSEGDRLGRLIDAGFDIRSGLLTLSDRMLALVAEARSIGAHATFAGSGGAIVGTYRDDTHLGRLTERLAPLGATTVPLDIG